MSQLSSPFYLFLKFFMYQLSLSLFLKVFIYKFPSSFLVCLQLFISRILSLLQISKYYPPSLFFSPFVGLFFSQVLTCIMFYAPLDNISICEYPLHPIMTSYSKKCPGYLEKFPDLDLGGNFGICGYTPLPPR